MFVYEKKLQYPVKIKNANPRLAALIISQYGGPDGELGASLRYLSQRYSMPYPELKGLLTDIGTEELGHLEMVGTIVHQLTRTLTQEQIASAGFAPYFVDHTAGVYPQAASGTPWSAATMAVTGDPIADLTENLAAEQKARVTYDNILRISDDPDVNDAIRFLREREVVHFQRFGEAKVPDFPIPYHTDIMESFDGIDMDAAGRVSGNGFYYLMGDIARLHEAVLAYGRDFMIDKGFTYCIPPFMIHGNVVEGVMSQTDMDAMMYKIEGEDLYLIGTSEHSMIGKFIDQIIPEDKLPQTLTSYSPCFRKEKGAHGIEERGVYRIHQFEKQEMIVVCKPEDSKKWYEQMWQYSVELFRSLDIPVRQLECCSGDLADLKCKSCDIEAWSPRQQKYFEVCSCSNLGDAQARRLKIRYKDADGKMQLCHTLNNTVVAPPRMLIAFLENNLQADGSVLVPEVLRPYMGGKERLIPLH